MKSMFLTLTIACMFAASALRTFAQDSGVEVSGSIGAGGVGMSQDSKDAAKLQEYRDLFNGALGTFDLRLRSSRFYHDWYGENLGRDDMYFSLQGGMYDRFKYRFYGDWIKHNFGFGPNGARTPYTDPGSHDLTLFATNPTALSNTNVPPWTSFDFAVDRRNIGGSFEWSGTSPFYLLLDANRVDQAGINKVDAAALGTSPGNGFVELPYHVDFNTRNISAEAGYQSSRSHVSVNWMQSNFGHHNTVFSFQNPFFGFGNDAATFAPGNHYVRIAVNGMVRKLPLQSTLSGRVTYDKVSDEVGLIGEVLNTSGSAVLTPTAPSSPKFDGKVENTTVHGSLASEPAKRLETRVYYNYYRRTNSSTDIIFQVPLTTTGLVCFAEGTTSAANVNIACEGDRYEYRKHNPGVEAGYDLGMDSRVIAGYDYLHTNRNRFDSDETRESKYFVQWANSSLDTLTVRVRYQFLRRRSEFLTDHAGFDANSPYFLERYNRSFDVSNLNQHLLKATADWSPIPLLDIGFEAYYKRNTYKGLVLGRINDRRKEFYGSIAYGDPEKFQVTLFGDIEYINYYSFHRTVNSSAPCSTAAGPNCFSPFTAPNASAYNWNAWLRDRNWTLEFGADWPISEKLTLKGSAIVQETKGGVDFLAQPLSSGAPAGLLFPILAYDNTRRRSVSPQAVYQATKELEFKAGYSFEKYRYQDDQFNGYQYTIGSGTTTSYLSGIYAFPDYRAHIIYGSVRYLF